MIKISVDTEEELQDVRRVLRREACIHTENRECEDPSQCAVCIDSYYRGVVSLYKREVVEEKAPLVV